MFSRVSAKGMRPLASIILLLDHSLVLVVSLGQRPHGLLYVHSTVSRVYEHAHRSPAASQDGAGRRVGPAQHLSFAGCSAGAVAEATAVCEGREVTVAKNPSRDSTSLAFFLGAGRLEAAVKGG